MPEPLMHFESHTASEDMAGQVYVDRLEWQSARRARRRRKTFALNTLPIADVRAITSRKDGLRHVLLALDHSGGRVIFRVHLEEAGPLRHLLDRLRAGDHASQQLAAAAPAPVEAGGWHADPHGRHELRYWNGRAWTEHVWDQGVGSLDPAR